MVMKRRLPIILSILLMIMLYTFASSNKVYASDLASGNCGDNVTWRMDASGTLIISGNGPMWDMNLNQEVPWYHYISQMNAVRIEEGVTHVGDRMFKSNLNISSVSIPNSVSSIGEAAFYSCSNLTKITVPESVTNIESMAFAYNGTVTAGPIGGGYDYEFGWKDEICAYAFAMSYDLQEVTLPEGITSIGKAAFYDCTALKEIRIPSTVVTLGESAFGSCESLEKLTIPAGVVEIGFEAFNMIPIDTAGPIGGGYDLEYGWTTEIPENAFSGLYSLKEVTFPSEVTAIGADAFFMCKNLTSVIIPEGVKSIGAYAFQGCEKLKYVSLPKSLETIEEDVFTANMGDSAPQLYTAGPVGGDYNLEFAWDESIPTFAFSNMPLLQSATIPEGIEKIGAFAFYKCTRLNKVTIPGSVIEIGIEVFAECPWIGTAGPIGGGYNYEFGWEEVIPSFAFYGCRNLNKLTIPGSITEIGYMAFFSMGELVTAGPIGGGYDYEFGWTTEMPKGAFMQSNISSVVLPETVTNISENAFNDCPKLKNITIPESVTSIGDYAFRNCSGLKEMVIPESVASIGIEGFYGSGISKITFDGNAPLIGSDAFKNMKATAYYALGNDTWTSDKFANYGGEIEWIATCGRHSFSTEPIYTWASNNKKCTAALACKTNGCQVTKGVETVTCTSQKVNATCEKEGNTTYTAVFITNGYETQTKVVSIAKLGHNYMSGMTPATCTEDAYMAYICRSCSYTYKVKYGDAKGHLYGNTLETATLTTNGKITKYCIRCANVSETSSIYYPKTIKLNTTKYTYNGKAKTPVVTVKDSKGNTLKEKSDYTLIYGSGRKNAGRYSVTVKFQGKYSGEKKLYFYVLPSKTSKMTAANTTTSIKMKWKKVTGTTGYKVELVSAKGKVLKSVHTNNLSYTFKNLSKATTYKVRVTAYKTIDSKKQYSLVSTTLTTTTAPVTPTIKVKVGSRKVDLSWNKIAGTGYEIQYAASSKFSGAKTITISKNTSLKKTVSGLKNGKRYYFKIRAYKTVGGTKVYGSWSTVKSIKLTGTTKK